MKIAIVINDTFSAWLFRKGLIKTLISQGHDVTVVGPSDEHYAALLREAGAKHHSIPIHRFISPLTDIRTCAALYRFFRKEKPDAVHNFTIKPNIYGTLVARLAGIKNIFCSATGLGQIYSPDGSRTYKILRFFVTGLFRLTCLLCTKFSFQNGDDLAFFVSNGILPAEKAALIRGSGVDLEEYRPEAAHPEKARLELKLDADSFAVLMVTRAIWNKGVREFIDASKIVREKERRIKFVLLGGIEKGPQAVPQSYLDSEASDSFVWIGFKSDVRDYMAAADVIVLPSYYQEGIPRCLLEAMAMSKPIITTDSVGCREVVEDSRNGYLVPIKDAEALAERVIKLFSNRARVTEFGQYSREKVEAEFSEKIIIQQTLSNFYQPLFS